MKYLFEPTQDITAYEVAYIISHWAIGIGKSVSMTGVMIDDDQWEKIPDNVKRHFKRKYEDNSV